MMTKHEGEDDLATMRASTALGDFTVVATARGLRAVTPVVTGGDQRSAAERAIGQPRPGATPALRHARAAADALQHYAAGEPAGYDGPFDITASPFHHAVWERLRAIPFGATTSYGRIAAALGMPGEAQTVGGAVGDNPVCVLVPCHRVVGADGSLRGFAWGLDLKRRLLAHEGSAALPLFADAGPAKSGGAGQPDPGQAS